MGAAGVARREPWPLCIWPIGSELRVLVQKKGPRTTRCMRENVENAVSLFTDSTSIAY